jgi:hypothetical protein
VVFPYEAIAEITKTVSPCDCTRVIHRTQDKSLVISYTPKAIPPHLSDKGGYDTKKTVKVYFKRLPDGVEEMVELEFTGTVTR